MAIKWVDDEAASFEDKTVFVRVDFNVPLTGAIGERKITDDTRIRAALPTLELLLSKGAKLVIGSHLGRPKGKTKAELSLEPIAERLQEFLNRDVVFTEECTGDGVRQHIAQQKAGDVLVLENLRFHGGEKKNQPGFCQKLAAGIDIYVNDAFGTAHRAHASTAGLPALVEDRFGGLLLRKEVETLGNVMRDPARPFVAILGGAKVSDKIGVLSKLLDKVDTMIVGGAMAYTFLKAQGHAVGDSRVEDERLLLAQSILNRCEDGKPEMLLPTDHVVAESFDENATPKVCEEIAPGMMGLDIGPQSRVRFAQAIAEAKTVFWNGPMGVFEWHSFSNGTQSVTESVAAAKGFTVVGGGDSVAALNKSGMAKSIDHVSTGGGASMELLEGKTLPGLAALDRV